MVLAPYRSALDAFINFDTFIGHQVNGFEIGESVRIAEIDPVDENIDSTMMKVVPEGSPPDLELSLVGPEPGLKSHARGQIARTFV